MANILCIGIATLDIVNEVASYPSEDDEIRILSQEKSCGGNATNSAVILSQLGHQCHWAGTLVSEADAEIIINNFKQYKINYDFCQFLSQGKVPTSYITLSRDTGSRTIIHYRDLAEYSFKAFKKINLQQFDWFHFEGRNVRQSRQMMSYCKKQQPNITLSVEIEKPRDNIELLIHAADIVLFSKQYALLQGFSNAKEFCQKKNVEYPDKIIICAWGDSGAAASMQQKYHWQPAFSVNVIDTLGAGDVFNAGIIDQQIQQQSIEKTLAYACQLAGKKCSTKGMKI